MLLVLLVYLFAHLIIVFTVVGHLMRDCTEGGPSGLRMDF